MPPHIYPSGPALVDLSFMGKGGGYSATNNINAAPGGGQLAATPLNAAVNRITRVATANDSVALPAGTGDQQIVVFNGGANALQVFGALGTTDTINGAAGNVGISLAAGKAAMFASFYVSPTQSLWFSMLGA
jgi:hypothetical protein